jgi:hypothetical protein
MRLHKYVPSIAFFLMAASMTVMCAAAQSAAPKENVIFNFPSSGDVGNSPTGTLISDGAGNFYGVNTYGGQGSGAVYEISPAAGGGWTAKSIYTLSTDEFFPNALVRDSSGNLYGTLYSGGSNICTDGYGDYSCGAIYELSPDGSGGWTEQILWSGSQGEGWRPFQLAIDAAGNLYVSNYWTGLGEQGTVVELTRNGGQWTHTPLHFFGHAGSEDGALPENLVFDKAGNIFGAAYFGGQYGGGTVFELKKTNSGWKEITLFSFDPNGSGGYAPIGITLDSAGNIYGSTDDYFNPTNNVAFELTHTSSGTWQETVLHTFVNGGKGGYSLGPLVIDANGNLYGSASVAGPEGSGTVFRLSRSANRTWSEVILHSFPSGPTDGENPNGLLFDSKGNLFGTTAAGGSEGVGTVFEITH